MAPFLVLNMLYTIMIARVQSVAKTFQACISPVFPMTNFSTALLIPAPYNEPGLWQDSTNLEKLLTSRISWYYVGETVISYNH